MFGWLKKSKKKNVESGSVARVVLNPTEYPSKIILAWSKAVEGNKDILKWLSEHGYKELAVACWAINLEEEGRKWLMVNGFPHLMAFINAAEGNKSAQKWLEMHGFQVYFQMSLAIDGDVDAYRWLQKNTTPDVFILTKSIERAKDEIEDRHRDIHKFGDW